MQLCFLCFICYTTLQRRWQTLTAAVDTWPKITATKTTTTVTTRATTTITTISGSTWRPPFLSVCWSFNFCRADLQLQSLLTHTPYTTPHIYTPEQGRRGRGGILTYVGTLYSQSLRRKCIMWSIVWPRFLLFYERLCLRFENYYVIN